MIKQREEKLKGKKNRGAKLAIRNDKGRKIKNIPKKNWFLPMIKRSYVSSKQCVATMWVKRIILSNFFFFKYLIENAVYRKS